jgi:hypothetical protein
MDQSSGGVGQQKIRGGQIAKCVGEYHTGDVFVAQHFRVSSLHLVSFLQNVSEIRTTSVSFVESLDEIQRNPSEFVQNLCREHGFEFATWLPALRECRAAFDRLFEKLFELQIVTPAMRDEIAADGKAFLQEKKNQASALQFDEGKRLLVRENPDSPALTSLTGNNKQMIAASN